jgi:MFS family permease
LLNDAPTLAPAGHSTLDDFGADAGALVACIVGFACSLTTLGFTYSIGIFVAPLHQEFGWSRERILLAQTIVTLIAVVLCPFVGWICDRFGVRRLVIGSQIGIGLCFLALGGVMHSLLGFYLIYGLMALLGAGTLGMPFVKLLSTRFDRRRGLALGIAQTGTGICGIVVPPFASAVLVAAGWRSAYAALAALPLLVALPLSIAFVRDPPAAGSAGSPGPLPAGSGPSGATVGEAMHGRRFWTLCIAFGVCSGAITAVLTNLVPLLVERGFAAARAAALASGFGVAVIVGRVAVGALIDRYWAPLIGFALFAPAAVALGLLSVLPLSGALTLAVIALGGLAAGAEVDLLAYLVSRYYGLRHFGRIYAAVYVAFALGPGILVPLFGRLRDVSGSYAAGLAAVAAALGLCGALLLTLGRYPRTVSA